MMEKHENMNQNNPPFHQTIIQKLPFTITKNISMKILNLLYKSKVTAIVNSSKMKLDLGENIQREMFFHNYEPEQTTWFKQCLHLGDTAIDVGASFGWYTTLAASLVGSTGKVFAFEPSPIANQVIELMIKDSRLQNIILTKAAVGRQSGNVSLFLPTTRYLHSPSIFKSDPSFVPVQVSIIALDHFRPLENVPKIKLVKIDVEGSEPDVLAGMEGLIKEKRVENIICEFNSGWLKRNSMTPEQLHKCFLKLGYRVAMQTSLKKDCVGHDGELFSLQDRFYTRFYIE
jgi:FkbM family methyltransferase